MRFLSLFITLVFYTPIAVAQNTVEQSYTFKTRLDLYALVKAKDVDAVEALFVESDEALQELGPTHAHKFRALMGIFGSTHPDIESFMPLWLEQHPNSVYPQVAEGFRQLHIGWFFRGNTVMRFISKEARVAFEEHFSMAAALAKTTYKERPDLVATADLARQAHQIGYGWRSSKNLYYETLKNHRDVPTIKRSLQVLAPAWGGSLDLVFKTCEIFAPDAIADFPYNIDICKAAYILEELNIRKHPQLFEWAFEVLDRTPIEGMMSNRLDDLVRMRPEQEGGDEIAAKLYIALKKRPLFLTSLLRNGYVFSEHFAPFSAEMDEAEIPPVLVLEDTYNPKVLFRKIHKVRDGLLENGPPPTSAYWDGPEVFAEYNALLDKFERYGRYNTDLYVMRVLRETNYRGKAILVDNMKQYETAIYYSNHQPQILQQYIEYLNKILKQVELGRDEDGILAFLDRPEKADDLKAIMGCPLHRAVTIMNAICPKGTKEPNCLAAFRRFPLWKPKETPELCPAGKIQRIEQMIFELPD